MSAKSGQLHYLKFADFLSKHAEVLSFKAASTERLGIRNIDEAIGKLYYHLLIGGIEHEDDTKRAPLPRNLQVVKDAEEAGRDQLLLADLRDKLKQVAASRFKNQLSIGGIEAHDSKNQHLLQVADLYAGSVNRVLEYGTDGTSHKDVFAKHFLESVHFNFKIGTVQHEGDVSIHLTL